LMVPETMVVSGEEEEFVAAELVRNSTVAVVEDEAGTEADAEEVLAGLVLAAITMMMMVVGG